MRPPSSTSDPVRLNRPVHVARRDAYVERAVDLMSQSADHGDVAAQIRHVRRVIGLLEAALEEAELAARGGDIPKIERDFMHFLEVALGNVRSAAAMMENQLELEAAEHSFLVGYLGVAQDEVALIATNYRRLSADVLAALWHLLGMLPVPYRALREENSREFDEDARVRYRVAYDSIREELARQVEPPTPMI